MIRRLRADDRHTFLNLLRNLTDVGDVTKENFVEQMGKCETYVIEDAGEIVGCGSLYIEDKFTHSCGRAAHIEDVVVDPQCRGMGLGRCIIRYLTHTARSRGCYKITLNCKESNIKFYEKCGFQRGEIEMVMRLK